MGDPDKKRMHRFRTEEILVDPGPPRMFASPDVKTRVATLGTGTPSPNPFRFGPAGALIVNDTPYLIDAGEGILRSIAKTATAHDRQLVDCFDPKILTRLFITHLHSDHIVGLPSLILFPWIFGKADPLVIHGPAGTRNLVEKIIDGYRQDITERIHGPERANKTGRQVIVNEISGPGFVYEDANVRVEAFAHAHGSLQNFGYRFSTEDRVVVWAGDGKIGKAFQEACLDADVLVSELCSQDDIGKAPWGGMSLEEKEAIIWSYHVKPSELAQLATQAKVKLLVLNHESNYSSPYNTEALLEEIKQFYNGKVISSRDGDVF
jgi:ribonuclease BN (tRNA processing enzyme)